MSNDTVRLSKRISWLLRHGANESHLAMDEAGWAATTDMLAILHISESELQRAVTNNDKGRLQLRGSEVRACQGHSPSGTPVTLAALEASWELLPNEGSWWHGTRLAAINGIVHDGILPGRRTHVHLTESPDSPVGRRASVDVHLEVSAAHLGASGLSAYRAPNGVILTRRVPTESIINVRGESRKGVTHTAAVRAQLHLR